MANEQILLLQRALTVRTKAEANIIFRRLVRLVQQSAWTPTEEAEHRVRSQIAYFAGFRSRWTRMRIERLFACECPVRQRAERRLPEETFVWTYSVAITRVS